MWIVCLCECVYGFDLSFSQQQIPKRNEKKTKCNKLECLIEWLRFRRALEHTGRATDGRRGEPTSRALDCSFRWSSSTFDSFSISLWPKANKLLNFISNYSLKSIKIGHRRSSSCSFSNSNCLCTTQAQRSFWQQVLLVFKSQSPVVDWNGFDAPCKAAFSRWISFQMRFQF